MPSECPTPIDSMLDQYERGGLSRRQLVLALAGLAAGVGGIASARAGQDPPAGAPAGESTFHATELNHLALNVTDIGRSRDFYMKHLGLTVMREGRSQCFLDVGPHFLALFLNATAAPGLNHYCYTVKGYTADSAVETLKSAGFAPRRAENRVYFDDPDGLEVQVSATNE
jgi:catechol 2,3-dioxygenase-like lactoylglutathione lyase family enzyme